MKTSLLIVTFAKDLPWLNWCLRSVTKFVSGFHELVLAFPSHDPCGPIMDLKRNYRGRIPVRIESFEEWPDKGFVHHMAMILNSDKLCPESDFIAHIDPDCIFCQPTSPDDYFIHGRPVLIGATYQWVATKEKNPQYLNWKTAVENAIGGNSLLEFMRRHPTVHYRKLYAKARQEIERHTGRNCDDYIRSTQNTFQHTFTEFPTLGEIAWRFFHPEYHWIRQETDPWPKDHLLQFWGHGPLDKPNNTWKGGSQIPLVPNEIFNQLNL